MSKNTIYKAFCFNKDAVAMVAAGEDPTAGFEHHFKKDGVKFRFVTEAPSGPVAEVITPFVNWGVANLDGKDCPRSIQIIDESGEHTVDVKPISLSEAQGDDMSNG